MRPAAASVWIWVAAAEKAPNWMKASLLPPQTTIKSLARKLVKRCRWLAICVFTGTVSAPPLLPMPLGSVTREPPWP